jgi:hypothetical protein
MIDCNIFPISQSSTGTPDVLMLIWRLFKIGLNVYDKIFGTKRICRQKFYLELEIASQDEIIIK